MKDKELRDQIITIGLSLHHIANCIPDQKLPDASKHLKEIESAVLHMYEELKYYKNLVEDNNNVEA